MFIDRRLFSSLSTCMAEQHLINLKTIDTVIILLLLYLQGLVSVCWYWYLILACVAAISGPKSCIFCCFLLLLFLVEARRDLGKYWYNDVRSDHLNLPETQALPAESSLGRTAQGWNENRWMNKRGQENGNTSLLTLSLGTRRVPHDLFIRSAGKWGICLLICWKMRDRGLCKFRPRRCKFNMLLWIQKVEYCASFITPDSAHVHYLCGWLWLVSFNAR